MGLLIITGWLCCLVVGALKGRDGYSTVLEGWGTFVDGRRLCSRYVRGVLAKSIYVVPSSCGVMIETFWGVSDETMDRSVALFNDAFPLPALNMQPAGVLSTVEVNMCFWARQPGK